MTPEAYAVLHFLLPDATTHTDGTRVVVTRLNPRAPLPFARLAALGWHVREWTREDGRRAKWVYTLEADERLDVHAGSE